MAYQHDGNALALRHAEERRSALSHLRHTPGRPRHAIQVHRLDTIDYNGRGPQLDRCLQHLVHRRRAVHQHAGECIGCRRGQARSAVVNLLLALLAAHVQHLLAGVVGATGIARLDPRLAPRAVRLSACIRFARLRIRRHPCHHRGELQQESGLANARLSADECKTSRHHPPAEHTHELRALSARQRGAPAACASTPPEVALPVGNFVPDV
mmetsp:Transcript_12610/g.53049  ORF Transcript_12610/g.53049 Transcript_12610/m.53049 type:complete len:211 (-) Transcript_12610:77-709(-)